MRQKIMFETLDGKLFATVAQARSHEEATKTMTLNFVSCAVEMPREEGTSFLVKLMGESGKTYFSVLK